ncbi:hypothetical protein Tco_0333002 [Tanacetum coccineum]
MNKDDSTTATPMNDASKEAPIDGSKKAHKVLKSYLKKSAVTVNPNANFVKTAALDRPTPLSFVSARCLWKWDDQKIVMEDEEVPLVDGVFEGALGALGDES